MKFYVMLYLCKQDICFLVDRGSMIERLCIMAILIGTLLPIRVGMLFWHLYLLKKYMKNRRSCLKGKKSFRLPWQRKGRMYFLQIKGIPWVRIVKERRKSGWEKRPKNIKAQW